MLAACRGLRAAGYDVAVGASTGAAPAQWSRSCGERVTTPDPRHGRAEFVAGLERVLGERRYDVVLPGTEASLLAVSAARDRLEPLAQFGLPSRESVSRSVDKAVLLEAAADAGLAAPASQQCEAPDRAHDLAAALGYPVVVKAGRSFLETGDVLMQQRTLVAHDPTALASVVASFEGPIILQRYIVGGRLLSFAGVMLDRIVGATCARYVRTWPVGAGPSCFSVTIPVPRGLRARVEALLGSVGWRGIFQLQLVERDEGLAAIDLNPRVFGSLALPIGAGANLPGLWCDSLLGRPVVDADASVGVHYRWEDGDAKHGVWQVRHGNVRAGVAVLRPRRRVVHAYFRREDPAPLLLRVWNLARGLGTRGVRSERPRVPRAPERAGRGG